jgi:hypothetical protein
MSADAEAAVFRTHASSSSWARVLAGALAGTMAAGPVFEDGPPLRAAGGPVAAPFTARCFGPARASYTPPGEGVVDAAVRFPPLAIPAAGTLVSGFTLNPRLFNLPVF